MFLIRTNIFANILRNENEHETTVFVPEVSYFKSTTVNSDKKLLGKKDEQRYFISGEDLTIGAMIKGCRAELTPRYDSKIRTRMYRETDKVHLDHSVFPVKEVERSS